VAALGTSAVPVAVVNPRQVRDFVRSQGKPIKTDRRVEAVIARFGEVSGTIPQSLVPAAAREFSALDARRQQVVQMKIAEQQRRQRASPVVQWRINRVLAVLERELEKLDQDLNNQLRESPL